MLCSSKRKSTLLYHVAFIRGVRTRSRFKIELKSDSNKVQNNSLNTEINQEIENIESTPISTSKQSPNSNTGKRSRFSTKLNPKEAQIKEAMAKFGYKDPEIIKRELNEKFQNDGVDADADFIERMVSESKKEADLLKQYLKDPKSTRNDLTNEEVNHFVDWLIQNGQKEIMNQEIVNQDSLDNKLNNLILSDDQSPESLVEAFDIAGELGSNENDALGKLPQFLYRISRLRNSDLASNIHLDKYSALYTISTAIKNDNIRNQCIYLCGKMLYLTLEKEFGPKMRPDPINEKFYIESLIAYQQYPKALELFESRKEKDVKEERFWFEVGCEIHFAMGDIDKGIELIDEIKDKWGYISSLVLIKGLKLALNNQNVDDALWFWEEIQMNIENIGIQKEIVVPETQLMNDSKLVYDYYNRVEPIGWELLNEVVFAFIGNMRFAESFNILEYINSNDKEYLPFFIESFKSSFDTLGKQLFLKESTDSREKGEGLSSELNDIFIKELSEKNTTEPASIEETFLMNNILVYLNRLAVTNKRELATINDLQETIRNDIPLTTFDANSLLNLLLQSRSSVGLQLATEMLNFMNRNASDIEYSKSTLPKANSHLYGVFCRHLLSFDRPKFRGLDGVLKIMQKANISIEEPLASSIILRLTFNKQFEKAISFIESYILTNDPIAVKEIKNMQNGKSLWTICLLAYYKSILVSISDAQIIKTRQQSLNGFVHKIISHNVKDEKVIGEAIGTLLAYNDTPTCIALIKWYGSTFGRELNSEVVIGIKAKLETRILKLEKNLTEDQLQIVRQYKNVHGLIPAIKYRAEKQTVDDVVKTLTDYSSLFGYSSNTFNVMVNLSDVKRQIAKEEFEKLVQFQLEDLIS